MQPHINTVEKSGWNEWLLENINYQVDSEGPQIINLGRNWECVFKDIPFKKNVTWAHMCL
jgi:hypothetical protein